MTEHIEAYEPVPEVLERVKKARERLHLTDKQCPCAPSEAGRGCVGAVCLAEIYSRFRCHCGAYKKIEVWKDIKGYEGCYQVSDYGRVRSLDRLVTNSGLLGKTKTFLKKGRVLSDKRVTLSRGSEKGYKRTTLAIGGKAKTFQTHRLVAEAFIPNPEGKLFVDHINQDTLDNRACNLRWVTVEENNSFLTTRLRNAKRTYQGDTALSVAKKNGISKACFCSRIQRGWTVDEACTKPVKRKETVKNDTVLLEGNSTE